MNTIISLYTAMQEISQKTHVSHPGNAMKICKGKEIKALRRKSSTQSKVAMSVGGVSSWFHCLGNTVQSLARLA